MGHRAELLIPQWQCNGHPISAQPLQYKGFPIQARLCGAGRAKAQGCRGQLLSGAAGLQSYSSTQGHGGMLAHGSSDGDETDLQCRMEGC